MSRISRYQESIEKFIKNKNIDTYFSDEYTDIINNNLIKSDHLCGIILSTIFNHNSKKSSVKGHGYFLGISVDILLIMLNTKNLNLNQNLLIGIFKLLHENVSLIKCSNQEDLNKIILKTYDYFNSIIYDIISTSTKMQIKKMIKSDLLNLKTINDVLYKKISSMNRYVEEDIVKYIKTSYGGIGKIVIVLSWILGGGNQDKKIITSLELIGEKFGMIYKICNDFENIIPDINSCDQSTQNTNITKNIVINIGIQESFSLFMELKSSFYVEALKLNIYTHTMKEVIDELETKIDKCIENSKVDMKSTYSSFSTAPSKN